MVYAPGRWACSSAGEHYVDIVGVTGSIPVLRTIFKASAAYSRIFSHFSHIATEECYRMSRRLPYLLNRKGHYHFRMAVPAALIPLLGKREIAYSLNTKDVNEARKRSLCVLLYYPRSFD